MEIIQTISVMVCIISLYIILLSFCLRGNRINRIIHTRIPSIIDKYEKEVKFYNNVIFYNIIIFLISSLIFIFTV